MAPDSKLTLADFTFRNSGLVARPGTEFEVLSRGFHTCGAGCPYPRACLANERCERGSFDARPVQGDIARALDETAATSNQLTATYAALRAATEPLGDTLSEEQYAVRDAAWQAYYTEYKLSTRYNSVVIGAIHDAFDGGWAARKKADYEMVFRLDKPKAE